GQIGTQASAVQRAVRSVASWGGVHAVRCHHVAEAVFELRREAVGLTAGYGVFLDDSWSLVFLAVGIDSHGGTRACVLVGRSRWSRNGGIACGPSPYSWGEVACPMVAESAFLVALPPCET